MKKKIINVDVAYSWTNFDKSNDNRVVVVAMKMNNFPLVFLSKYICTYVCIRTLGVKLLQQSDE